MKHATEAAAPNPFDVRALWDLNGGVAGFGGEALRAWMDGVARMQAEATAFWTGRASKDAAALAAFTQCTTPTEAMQAQVRYAREAVADYYEEGQRLMRIASDARQGDPAGHAGLGAGRLTAAKGSAMDMRRADARTTKSRTPARSRPRRGGRRRPRALRPCRRAAPASPDPSFLRDSYAATAIAETMDRSLHAGIAHYSAGLSPMAQIAAYWDWASHLAFSPGKRLQLAEKGVKKSLRLAAYALRRAFGVDGDAPCIEPLPQDKRFDHAAWRGRAVRRHLPVVPADPAVVVQRDHRRARRDAAARADGVLRRAPVPRRVLAVQLRAHQSGGAGPHACARAA